ncbi:MAG TPA: tetratricopeptide repeat protein [Caldilineaceae bacterium]|nr:tetratricopeptide repeat protein [Caldilineaceae bacterium]
MSPQEKFTPPIQLTTDDVLLALRNWRNLSFVESRFAELHLVCHLLRETQQMLHHAIIAVLERGLALLAHSNAEEAQLLTRRFRNGETVDEVAAAYSVSSSRLHNIQREAVRYLTLTLNHLEETAWHDHMQRMLLRLDATVSKELIGVDVHIERLLELLRSTSEHWIIAIEGIGGIGKTSLADATVRRAIAEHLFIDLAWVTARQERLNAGGIIVSRPHTTLSAVELIEALAAQLIPQSAREYNLSYDQLLVQLSRQLRQWPHLIVIDNLETVVDLESLLPTLNALVNPSKFLLTSRMALYSASDIFHFRVPELKLPDALTFIRSEISNRNLTALADWDEEKLKTITSVTGGNPLAIRLVVGQAHVYDFDLILKQLSGIGGKPAGNLFLYIYQQSWDRLGEEARRLLLMMPLVNPNGDDLAILTAVSDLPISAVEEVIAHLVAINLVDVSGDGSQHTYRIHSLTRTFLREKIVGQTFDPAEGDPYQRYFKEALDRGLGLVCKQVADEHNDLLHETIRERSLNLLSYALLQPTLWPSTIALFRALIPSMERAGQRDQWIPYLERGVALSQITGDDHTEATLALAIGELYRLQSNYAAARDWLNRSITQFTRHGDQLGLARALNQLAYLAWRQHDDDETIALATHALELSPAASMERAMSLSALGLAAIDRLQWSDAESYHRQALDIRLQHKSQRQIAWSLQNLAYAIRGQGRYDEAVHYYEQAIQLLDAVRDPLHWAVAQMNLGIVYSLQGESTAALTAYWAAEKTFRAIGDTFNLAKLHVNKGIEYLALPDLVQAEHAFTVGSELFDSLEDRNEYLNAMDGLGMTFLEQGRYTEAEGIFVQVMNGLATIDPASAFYQMLHPDKISAQLAAARRGKEDATPDST